jgi:WD40 repeat protein
MLSGQKSYSTSLLFPQKDKNKLFSGTVGGTVHVWDLATASDVVKFQGHLTACTAMASSENEDWLVSGSQDTKVKLWD